MNHQIMMVKGILAWLFCFVLQQVWSAVLIYADEGTSLDLIEHVEYALNLVGGIEARRIQAKDLDTPSWQSEARLLIIPGGRDLEYVGKISLQAINHIREFIEAGNGYLGICAGAYFASSRVEFEPGRKWQVIGDRSLSLFPGIAHGSALRPFSYTTNSMDDMPRRTVTVKLSKTGNYVSFYHMGGGWWEEEEVNKANWKVISIYAHSGKPAMIRGKVGKGRVILCGPHVEVLPERLGNGWGKTYMYQDLLQWPERRRNVLRSLLFYLRIPVKSNSNL